uniref:Uncharacterized protein n=1 Tax=Tanacetum cinerariifolium TaxID=118510 RepID=A0A6L2NU91_TANCI|nr:hypothetical protein [Tanacetum cinerariifolium]
MGRTCRLMALKSSSPMVSIVVVGLCLCGLGADRWFDCIVIEQGSLSQKGSGVGMGVKEKQVSSADKLGEGSKHVDQAMGTDSTTSTPIVVTTGLGSYPTLSEVHGHSPTSANEGDTNVAGTPAGNTHRSIRTISERFANTTYGFFLGKRVAYPVVANYNPDVNLFKKDVINVLVWVKLPSVPVTAFSKDGLSAIATKLGTSLMLDSYISDMCIQSWGRSSYARALIEVWANVELKDHIVVAMPKLVGEGFYTYKFRNMKKPSQANRGVSVGLKGMLLLWTMRVNLWQMFDSSGDHDSDDEVASVDNDMANFLASKKVGYDTNSLLEQWKKSYGNDDYDFDPFDDYMYESQDILDKIQAICDNLNIKVRGRKKK